MLESIVLIPNGQICVFILKEKPSTTACRRERWSYSADEPYKYTIAIIIFTVFLLIHPLSTCFFVLLSTLGQNVETPTPTPKTLVLLYLNFNVFHSSLSGRQDHKMYLFCLPGLISTQICLHIYNSRNLTGIHVEASREGQNGTSWFCCCLFCLLF